MKKKHKVCTACGLRPVAKGNYFLCIACYRDAESHEEYTMPEPKKQGGE